MRRSPSSTSGTNSTRLLVADVDGRAGRRARAAHHGHAARRGRRRDRPPRRRARSSASSPRSPSTARAIDELGAERAVAVATSAVRDAENGEQFRAAAARALRPRGPHITGDEEARLTFLGATSRAAAPARPAARASTSAAAAPSSWSGDRAATRLPRLDPGRLGAPDRAPPARRPAQPSSSRRCARDVRGIIEGAVPQDVREQGGGRHRGRGHRHVAGGDRPAARPLRPRTRARLQAALGTLRAHRRSSPRCRSPSGARSPGLHPERAPTIVAGAAILVEAMRAFGLDSIEVSEADILHGAALEAAAD